MTEPKNQEVIFMPNLADPLSAIQDGFLIVFNDPQNNQWIVENRIEHDVYDFRDLVKRFFWKRT